MRTTCANDSTPVNLGKSKKCRFEQREQSGGAQATLFSRYSGFFPPFFRKIRNFVKFGLIYTAGITDIGVSPCTEINPFAQIRNGMEK
ncbi:MAG: hypothetical protein FWE67_14710 [Planctomycetaceae bacterium]|nr:hypothetical protein [Planctomycetaceae bacterium]